MSAANYRKIDDEGRVFNTEWCSKYLVVPYKQDVVCPVCQSAIAFMNEYNGKRHYRTKHSSKLEPFHVSCSQEDKIY